MNEVSIYYKNKTKIIEELEKKDYIKTLESKSLIKKLSFSKDEYADIYFHTGSVDDKAIEMTKNVKKVIVSSYAARHELLVESKVADDKVSVIYPSIEPSLEKPKSARIRFCEKHDIDPKRKILLFTAKNIKSGGIKEFIQIVASLNYQNIQMIVASDAKQIYNLKFQLSKFNFDDSLLLLEDYEDMDEVYLASDIFILPTYTSFFAPSVLKAMASKCAVFVSANNSAREVVDVFATMENPNDPSTAFKVDALLSRKEDLKLIKKQNKKAASEFTLEKNLERLEEIIRSV